MFKRQYIYLVAGFREYTLDAEAKGLELTSLLDEVIEELKGDDVDAVKLLYGYYDCENLIAALSGRSSYNPLGRATREQLDEIVNGAEAETLFPAEVVVAMERYSGKDRDGGSLAEIARSIYGEYFAACSRSKSAFLRSWSEADSNLRNVAAAITARVAGRPVADVVVGESDVVDQLVKSSAADFGLRGELNYLDDVLAAVGEEQNIVEKERRMDMVRWSLIDELAEGEYFGLDAVLAYLAKVNIVARWRALDPERGREMFARLVEELSGKDLINKK